MKTHFKFLLCLMPMFLWAVCAAWFEWRWHEGDAFPNTGSGFGWVVVYRFGLPGGLFASVVAGLTVFRSTPNRTTKHAASIVIAMLFFVSAEIHAGTVLDFWHDYTPPQTGQKHFSFRLTDFKRGLFFGSCGISTKSLRWEYQFDLSGERTVYEAGQVNLLTDVNTPIRIVAGQISVDPKQTKAVIALQVEQGGVTNAFVGNGTYSIKRVK